MTDQLQFIPPSVAFDPLAAELFHEPGLTANAGPAMQIGVTTGRRSPFEKYSRELTPEGGILICYTDQNLTLTCTAVRVLIGTAAAGGGGWLVLDHLEVASWPGLGAVVALALLIWLIAAYKVPKRNEVEIRPDSMIIDGTDVFLADDIGENWPELKQKDAPDQFVMAGICGTRYVEYMTANRMDDNDRTPEVLAADLKEAMTQLWDRREVTFPGLD